MRSPGRTLGGLLRATYGYSAGGAPTPFETLQAALGADHVGHWEAPATDDATITVTSGRVASLSSLVSGNAMVPPVEATNAPLWMAPGVLAGIGGEGAIDNDGGSRFLEAALSVAAGRYGIFVVAKPRNTDASADVYADFSAGLDNSFVGVDFDVGAGVPGYLIRAAFSSGEVPLTITSPAAYFDTWRLHALLPYASGALSQIDGSTTTPNFATTNALRAFTAARWGASSSSGGIIKAIIVVDNVDATKAQAVRDYVLARWPLVGTPLARIVIAGQSNVTNQTETDFVELPGYTTLYKYGQNGTKITDWLSPNARQATLIDMLELSPPAPTPLVLAWDQGNSDCEFQVDADAYGANRETFRSELEAALGRSIFEVEFSITMTSATYPYVSAVNTQKQTYVTGRGASAVYIDSSTLAGGLEADGIHDDAARLAAKLVALRDALVTADLLP